MSKNAEYEIISLGYACITRTFLTDFELIKTKKQGRKSMFFDLAPHFTKSIAKILKDDFDKFFENFEFLFSESNNQEYWTNTKYNTKYVHDRDCINNFKKFKKRYEKRITNFKKALNKPTFTFFIHYTDKNATEEDVSNLYNQISRLRGNKPFKLIIWDIFDIINSINPEIKIIKDIHPQKSDEEWWNPAIWTDETKNWKSDLLKDTVECISDEGFKVVYYKKSKISILISNILNKILNLLKKILTITNIPEENRKILTLFGHVFTLKKLRKE